MKDEVIIKENKDNDKKRNNLNEDYINESSDNSELEYFTE